MWGWEGVREGVKMRRCERRCEEEQMWRGADVKMRRCEDEKMWRWEDVKMSRCEDEKVFFCQAKCSPSSGCMNYTSAVFEWTIKFPGKIIWSHSSRSIAIGESVFQIAVVSYQSAREGPKYMWTMDWVPVAYIGWEISWVVGCWFLLSCSERWKASERAISGQCARGLPRRNGEERRRRAWEVWKIILCSKASKCRRIWPR